MSPVRPKSLSVLALSALLALTVVLPNGAGAATPIDVAKLRNHIAICHTPLDICNFDDVGYGYSGLALTVGGTSAGDTVTADGFTYTWPDVGSGQMDNITLVNQVIPVDATGATRIGFLGTSHHGPVTANMILHYTTTDANGATVPVTVTKGVTFSDWTLNGGGAQPAAGNTIAVSAPARSFQNAGLLPDDTYVYSAAITLDPTMTLTAIEFPREKRVHLFDIAFA